MAQRDREDPHRPSRRRGQGELESQVLGALREAEAPVTAAWVQERLGGDLAYTTVVTILTRLLAKDAVARERRGRSFVWRPTADVAGLAALKMRRLLDGESDREAVLASFVTALPPDDEQVLRALLETAHATGGAGATDRSDAMGGAEATARSDAVGGGDGVGGADGVPDGTED
ncbi:BlaI/MecI/CopY family transcriptional regulator [Streptomyces olivochromogenes]|uniref:Transcriptional regulator n=1 Tax=Streptomyces olivochromogenes TaxID=1963 RepID=A0A250V535_STROL|nr:BlaI/MecI/CopY family transcriptional regulator [Streptomyces olivochromogenes]GAX49298.1 hypothetical protein SO3561_00787 [Streptomyces olivochromogenes]